MQDPLPIRLDRLAVTLSHISSSARGSIDPSSIVNLLNEAHHFIEWITPEIEPAFAAELIQMNRIIAMWRKSWGDARRIPQPRTLLAAQTKNWSNKVVRFLRTTG